MTLVGQAMYTVEIDIHMARAIVVVCCGYACIHALMSVKHMMRQLERKMLAFSCTTLSCLAIQRPCKWWFVHLNNRCGHVSTSWREHDIQLVFLHMLGKNMCLHKWPMYCCPCIGHIKFKNLAKSHYCDAGGFPECVGLCLIDAHMHHRICKSLQDFMYFAAHISSVSFASASQNKPSSWTLLKSAR